VNLIFAAEKIEISYDNLDTNAINFIKKNSYFSIQSCVYLDENEELNQPYFEFNNQESSQYGGISDIYFYGYKILINFEENHCFLEKYKTVEIVLENYVSRELVEFFNNYLFLGNFVHYDKDFAKSNIVAQTKERDYL
jgi:hypothetical protein